MAARLNPGRRHFLLASAALMAGGAIAQPRRLPLPRWDGPVALRVACFDNPQLPAIAPAAIDAVLAHAVALAREHLGLRVEFGPRETLDMGRAFERLPPATLAEVRRKVHDLDTGDTKRLVAATLRDLRDSGNPLEEQIAYAQAHLLWTGSRPGAWEELAQAVVETQLRRMSQWRPYLRHGDYHQYLAWEAAGRSVDWPWEVVLTNQLIASAEYESVSLHASLRGGVTNGLTTESRAGRHGLVSVLSLFPFFSDDAGTVALRGGIRASAAESPRWAAALLVHELGHQLQHLGHPYGNAACIMAPPPLLGFAQWVQGLDASRCAIGSEPQMRPGVVRFSELTVP